MQKRLRQSDEKRSGSCRKQLTLHAGQFKTLRSSGTEGFSVLSFLWESDSAGPEEKMPAGGDSRFGISPSSEAGKRHFSEKYFGNGLAYSHSRIKLSSESQPEKENAAMSRLICLVSFVPAILLLTSCAGWFESGPEPVTPPFREKLATQSVNIGPEPVKDTDAINMMITSLTMTLVSRGDKPIAFAITGESNAKKLAFRVMQKMVDLKLAGYAVSKPEYIVGSFVSENLEWTLRIVEADSGKRLFSKMIPLQAKENFGKNAPAAVENPETL